MKDKINVQTSNNTNTKNTLQEKNIINLLVYQHDGWLDKDCAGPVWSVVQSEVLLSCSFCALILPPTLFLAAKVDLVSFLPSRN